jgi:hypothetical protein
MDVVVRRQVAAILFGLFYAEEDDLRPLVYEMHGYGVGRIDGVRRGHAYINNHYGPIDKGGDVIGGMGEHCWETDGMAAFGHAAQQFHLHDWTYFAPWSWINFWPSSLEGMRRDQHAWKANNGPDRRDGVNGFMIHNLRGNNAVASAVFFDPVDRTRRKQLKRERRRRICVLAGL